MLSVHAILILAAVAGASRVKRSLLLFSNLAAFIASFMANSADAAEKSGGSPIAWKNILKKSLGLLVIYKVLGVDLILQR